MTTQLPSTNYDKFLDIGGAIVYFSKTYKTTYSSAESATDWRKAGVLKDGVKIAVNKGQIVDVKSGTPQVLVKRFYTEENLVISGEFLEISPFNLARAFGGLTTTITTKTSGPAATTVATGSTKSVVNVASATGYAAGDLISVGTTPQYGVIASISGNAFTLVEALDNDTTPTTGQAVAKVDTAKIKFGTVATPTNIAIKISKTFLSGAGTIDWYVLKAIAEGSGEFNYSDNGSSELTSIPFSFQGLTDPNVESGSFMQAVYTQA
jgi:hypothetical protein